MKSFDPNAASSDESGIFGLPYTKEESDLILLPIPWDVTTSYKAGTANGPTAILHASKQVDLFDLELGSFYKRGIAMLPLSEDIILMNKKYRPLAKTVIDAGGISTEEKELMNNADLVNAASNQLNNMIYTEVKS
jgi:agmatinase